MPRSLSLERQRVCNTRAYFSYSMMLYTCKYIAHTQIPVADILPWHAQRFVHQYNMHSCFRCSSIILLTHFPIPAINQHKLTLFISKLLGLQLVLTYNLSSS